MTGMSEGTGSKPFRQPKPPTLDDILDFFRAMKREKRLTNAELHSAFFAGRLHPGTLKDYLARKIPDDPQGETFAQFEAAYRQAKKELHPGYRLYQANLAALQLQDPGETEFNRYAGSYLFWRLGRFGRVHGTVEISRHRDAGFPCYEQEHTQTTDATGMHHQRFHYEGGIYWLAHNLKILNIAKGEMRSLLLRKVDDPSSEPLNGSFLTEEHDGNRSQFAGAILLLRKKWFEANSSIATDSWILRHLRNNAPFDDEGRQGLFRP